MEVQTKRFSDLVVSYYAGYRVVTVGVHDPVYFAADVDARAFRELREADVNLASEEILLERRVYKLQRLFGRHNYPILPVLSFGRCRFSTQSPFEGQMVRVQISVFESCLDPRQLLKAYDLRLRLGPRGDVLECVCRDEFQMAELQGFVGQKCFLYVQ